MFGKIQLTLSDARVYNLYVDGEHVEIVAIIDGHPARFGSARWDGTALRECTAPLRPDLLSVLVDSMQRRADGERAAPANERAPCGLAHR